MITVLLKALPWPDVPQGDEPKIISVLGCKTNSGSCSVQLQMTHTSSTAQGGGGSFKNGKPIGEVGCCESRMADRSHWWTERCLRSPLFLSLSLTIYQPTYLPLPIYLSIHLCIHLSIYLSIYLSLSISLSVECSCSCSVVECSVV